MSLALGLEATLEHVVTAADTATALGSGDVEVLATPRLLALAEAASVAALRPQLAPGATSVGTAVALRHLRATAVGGTVTVTARVVELAERTVRLTATAYDAEGLLVAEGEVVRAVVDRDRFLSGLARSRP